jgi:hypothetical protein
MSLQGDTKATDIIKVRTGLRLAFSHKTFSKASVPQLKSIHYAVCWLKMYVVYCSHIKCYLEGIITSIKCYSDGTGTCI